MNNRIETIYETVLEGQQKRISAEVQAALAEGLNPETILTEGMVAAMAEVGRLFEEGEYESYDQRTRGSRSAQQGQDHDWRCANQHHLRQRNRC